MEHEIFLRNCGLGLPCDFETSEGGAIYGRCNEPPFLLSQGRENRTSLSEESIAKEHSRRDHEEHSD